MMCCCCACTSRVFYYAEVVSWCGAGTLPDHTQLMLLSASGQFRCVCVNECMLVDVCV